MGIPSSVEITSPSKAKEKLAVGGNETKETKPCGTENTSPKPYHLNSVPDRKVRKLTHPRIKYSGVKHLTKTSATIPQMNLAPNQIAKKIDESPKHPELASPLNLDKLFPHVMSGGASFAQHSHLIRSINGEIDDVANYADIDDIELPDGSKIGYPTDLKRFSDPLPSINTLNSTSFGCIESAPFRGNQIPSNTTGRVKEPYTSSLNRLSFSSDTCDFIPPANGANTSGSNGLPNVGGNVEDSLEIYACRHCGKTYRWKSTLRRHENDECGDKKPAHECPYCPYKAKQRGNLGVHVRKHHFNKPQLETLRKRRSSVGKNNKTTQGFSIRDM